MFVSALNAAAGDEAMLPALRHAVEDMFEAYVEIRFIHTDRRKYCSLATDVTGYMRDNQGLWSDEMRMLAMLGAVMLNSWHEVTSKSKVLVVVQSRLEHVVKHLAQKPELRASCPLTDANLNTLCNIVRDKQSYVDVKEN